MTTIGDIASLSSAIFSEIVGEISTGSLVTSAGAQSQSVQGHGTMRTPDEMYSGAGEHIPAELEAAKREARRSRLEKNRQVTCEACV